MHAVKKEQGQSILKKTHVKLWLFLCAFFTAAFLAGLLLQYRAIRKDELTQKSSRCSDIATSLGNLMSMVDGYSASILYDSAMQQLLYAPSGDMYRDYQTFKTTVSRYIAVTDCIDAVTLLALDGTVYDYTKTRWPADGHPQPEKTDEKQWRLAPAGGTESGGCFFTLPRPGYYANSGKLLGWLETSVNAAQLEQLFASELSDHAAYYLTDAEGRILYADGAASPGAADPAQLEENTVVLQNGQYVFSVGCAENSWTVRCRLDRKQIFARSRGAVIFLTIGILSLLAGSYFLSAYSAQRITASICALTDQVKQLDGVSDRVHIESRDEVGTLAEAFNALLDKNDRISGALVEEQRRKRRYQVRLLQEQINPHFLYNTLDNISALAIMHEDELVVEMIDGLSAFYRGVLSRGDDVITLGRELEISENYLRIMKIRKHEAIQYTLDVPEQLMENVCLKILMQPILENCFLHALRRRDPEQPFRITIRAVQEQTRCLLCITDNGVGMPPERIAEVLSGRRPEEQHGFGLYSSQQRLQLYFGRAYGLTIRSAPGQGTQVLISLPLCSRDEFTRTHIS